MTCVDIVYPTYTIACHDKVVAMAQSAVLTEWHVVALVVAAPLVVVALLALASFRKPAKRTGMNYDRLYAPRPGKGR